MKNQNSLHQLVLGIGIVSTFAGCLLMAIGLPFEDYALAMFAGLSLIISVYLPQGKIEDKEVCSK